MADMLSDLRRGESKAGSIVLEPFRNVCFKKFATQQNPGHVIFSPTIPRFLRN